MKFSDMTEADLQRHLASRGGARVASQKPAAAPSPDKGKDMVYGEIRSHRASQEVKQPVKHKFNAQAVEADGIKFPSKLERDCYEVLKMLQKAGVILFFLRQVPIHLTGGTKLVVDFQVFWADGRVTFEDAKGRETPVFKLKKREVEALYPFEIKTITRKDLKELKKAA